jgi:cytochrome c oxidase assembly protein Cox11/cytochrome c2
MSENAPRGNGRNKIIALACTLVVVGMITLVGFSLPLYRAFCEATGFGGTTRRAATDTATASTRTIIVRFNTDVAPGLPWRFGPSQEQVTVHLGEPTQISYWAENRSDETLVAHATYNVTPEIAGQYFNKIQCFCFDEERLKPHERVEMPVIFYVDPSILDDKNIDNLPPLTLSYTFFKSAVAAPPKDLDRFGATLVSAAPPPQGDPTRGAHIFTSKCATCHALDHNQLGPMLGGLAGRSAGSVAGFDYSDALKQSGIVWQRSALDHWLANPRGDVPGARMPVNLTDPQARADVIAYLLGQPMQQLKQ